MTVDAFEAAARTALQEAHLSDVKGYVRDEDGQPVFDFTARECGSLVAGIAWEECGDVVYEYSNWAGNASNGGDVFFYEA